MSERELARIPVTGLPAWGETNADDRSNPLQYCGEVCWPRPFFRALMPLRYINIL